MRLDEFVKTLVKIEFIEDSNCFGLYPFPMFVETDDEKFELNSLALGGDVLSCYKRFNEYKSQNAKNIYIALDFPKHDDIENDFVAIFSYNREGDISNVFAITYNNENGEQYEVITRNTSGLLTKIFEDFKHHVK